MASSDKELEEQLLEAGNMLVDPPSSVDELLPLLDVSPNVCFNCVYAYIYIYTHVDIYISIYLFMWSSCAP